MNRDFFRLNETQSKGLKKSKKVYGAEKVTSKEATHMYRLAKLSPNEFYEYKTTEIYPLPKQELPANPFSSLCESRATSGSESKSGFE